MFDWLEPFQQPSHPSLFPGTPSPYLYSYAKILLTDIAVRNPLLPAAHAQNTHFTSPETMLPATHLPRGLDRRFRTSSNLSEPIRIETKLISLCFSLSSFSSLSSFILLLFLPFLLLRLILLTLFFIFSFISLLPIYPSFFSLSLPLPYFLLPLSSSRLFPHSTVIGFSDIN